MWFLLASMKICSTPCWISKWSLYVMAPLLLAYVADRSEINTESNDLELRYERYCHLSLQGEIQPWNVVNGRKAMRKIATYIVLSAVWMLFLWFFLSHVQLESWIWVFFSFQEKKPSFLSKKKLTGCTGMRCKMTTTQKLVDAFFPRRMPQNQIVNGLT